MYLEDKIMAKKQAKVKITQLRSKIGAKPNMVATLAALGLRRINHSVEHIDNEQIRGMINVVRHLVKVEAV
jgi:large subunit ribosomal protein L30